MKKTLTHQAFVEAIKNELNFFFEFLSALEELIRNLNAQQKPNLLEI